MSDNVCNDMLHVFDQINFHLFFYMTIYRIYTNNIECSVTMRTIDIECWFDRVVRYRLQSVCRLSIYNFHIDMSITSKSNVFFTYWWFQIVILADLFVNLWIIHVDLSEHYVDLPNKNNSTTICLTLYGSFMAC